MLLAWLDLSLWLSSFITLFTLKWSWILIKKYVWTLYNLYSDPTTCTLNITDQKVLNLNLMPSFTFYYYHKT